MTAIRCFLVACVLLASCVHAQKPPVASPIPSPPTPVLPAFDLSGSWISGKGDEPAGRTVTVTRPCNKTVTAWRLFQDGASLGGTLVPGTALEGYAHDFPPTEMMWGTIQGAELALEALPGFSAPRTIKLLLRYDATSGRLRGTRDGVPIWFAPLAIEEPPGCSDPLTVAPATLDLSGAWERGFGRPEPYASRDMEPGSCTHQPATWQIWQRGDALEAVDVPESFAQGIATRAPPMRMVPEITGTRSGFDVTLTGPGADYRLRYDPESGHLRGRFNGRAIWLVRKMLTRPEPCMPVP